MGMVMEEEFKRWTAKRKAALVTEIIQGKTTVAEASRAFDIPPSAIEEWVDEGRKGMENALRAKPLDIKEQYERQLKELQEAVKRCWSYAPEKNWRPCWARKRSDRNDPPGTQARRFRCGSQHGVQVV